MCPEIEDVILVGEDTELIGVTILAAMNLSEMEFKHMARHV